MLGRGGVWWVGRVGSPGGGGMSTEHSRAQAEEQACIGFPSLCKGQRAKERVQDRDTGTTCHLTYIPPEDDPWLALSHQAPP